MSLLIMAIGVIGIVFFGFRLYEWRRERALDTDLDRQNESRYREIAARRKREESDLARLREMEDEKYKKEVAEFMKGLNK